MSKSPEMKAFLDSMTSTVFGKSLSDCQDEGSCVTCDAPNQSNDPDLKFRDEISEREYKISGMCQNCQDSVFNRDS